MPSEDYLRAAQAAVILKVSPKTVTRWARQGRLPHVVTLGGHRRFRRSHIEGLAERLERPDAGRLVGHWEAPIPSFTAGPSLSD